MKPLIRVAIAGYGRSGCDIHARWIKNATTQYKVVAVADQIEQRRIDAKNDFNCEVFSDYKEMLKKVEFDLFINALPSFLHSRASVEAFDSKHHAVCEKPCGLNLKEFDRMLLASKKNKKKFFPFQNSRFFPFFNKMREVINSGVLGKILHIRSVWSGFGRRWDWQTLQVTGGGNLLNTGPHPLDHAIVLHNGQKPKVFCRMFSIQPFGGDAEDFCTLTLYAKNSPMIEILLSSYLAYPQGEQYNISGTLGGMTGGPAGLKWKYFDPTKAEKHELWKPWSNNRAYCSEKLPWIEESWTPPQEAADSFLFNSKSFYNNIYDVLSSNAEQIVKPAEVRQQIAIIEECHRQNPLPQKIKRWP